jgi:hypothetical protein
LGERLTAGALYARIVRTYAARAGTLLPLAVFVFVPLGLLEAISVNADLHTRDFGSGLLVFGVFVAALALVGTSLFGEIFYSGAVAVTLVHGDEGRPPSLREIARQLAWWRLLAVDLVFAAMVLAGLALLVVPGVMLYIWFGLAGSIVEIERRGARAAFRRSRKLVSGRFWLVFAVLAPIELGGEALGSLAASLAGGLLGHTIWAEWLAATLSNLAVTPFFAVAVVLLAVGLIAEKDGRAPRLDSAPGAP